MAGPCAALLVLTLLAPLAGAQSFEGALSNSAAAIEASPALKTLRSGAEISYSLKHEDSGSRYGRVELENSPGVYGYELVWDIHEKTILMFAQGSVYGTDLAEAPFLNEKGLEARKATPKSEEGFDRIFLESREDAVLITRMVQRNSHVFGARPIEAKYQVPGVITKGSWKAFEEGAEIEITVPKKYFGAAFQQLLAFNMNRMEELRSALEAMIRQYGPSLTQKNAVVGAPRLRRFEYAGTHTIRVSKQSLKLLEQGFLISVTFYVPDLPNSL